MNLNHFVICCRCVIYVYVHIHKKVAQVCIYAYVYRYNYTLHAVSIQRFGEVPKQRLSVRSPICTKVELPRRCLVYGHIARPSDLGVLGGLVRAQQQLLGRVLERLNPKAYLFCRTSKP